MALKLMYILNDYQKNTPSVDCNLWLKRMDTPLDEPTNQNSIKVFKFVKLTNKPYGTSVIYNTMPLTSLIIHVFV